MSIKGQGHSLTLVKGHSDFNVKTCFSQKQLGDLEPKFIWKLEGEKEWKFIQMSWVTWPSWPPCSLGSQSCLKHLAKWVNEVEWMAKVKIILWTWLKVTQISKLILVFHRNNWAIWIQNSYESWSENGNDNLYKWVGSNDQHGHNAYMW